MKLENMFKKAQEEHKVSQEIIDKINTLDDYVIEHFRLAFGNRIVKQLKEFVPSYVACGGTEIDGIDYVLCNKILRKFESLNLGFIRDEIDGLCDYLSELFGEENMGESKEYMTLPEENGSINISEEVIAAIAVGAVRDVEGVSGMMTAMGGSVTDLVTNKKNAQKVAKGVKIDMTGAALVLDIYLTVEYGHPIPEVAENAQKAVIGAVEAMTGCSVEAVNIHVGGVTLA